MIARLIVWNLSSFIMALVMRFSILGICLVLSGFSGCNSPRANSDVAPAPTAANPGTPPKKSAPPPQDNRPLIVAFGDSLSAGFGADPGQSYPDFLQKLLDRDGKSYHIYNAGVSGDTTTDGVERLPGILVLKPKIVILELGGNDGLRGLPLKTTRANMEQMIQALQSAGAKVVLAGMTLPPNYGAEYIQPFQQIYVQLAKQYHLTRIPFLLDGVVLHPNLMQNDGIHPTGEGNKIVAETVYRYLKPLL
jgi:acyl-CoA thioesterase-1